MNPILRAADSLIDSAAHGLKAATGTLASFRWARTGGTYIRILPRTKYDYAADVGQGLGSAIVIAVVSWIQRNFPEAPLRVQEKGPEGRLTEIVASDFGPGAMLKLLEYPNSFYSGITLLQATLVDYFTMANAYWYKRRNASGRVVELWWIPKILIRPRWDPEGSDYISHYEYNPNGMPIAIPVEDVVHFKDGLDPRNQREGLNKLAALTREIYTDDEAANFSATLLTNLGVPGVVLAPKDTGSAGSNRIVDPEGTKQKFLEKFGGDKRGEPLVMTSPTDVTVLSFNPQQMSLKDLRRLPEERVSGVLGVPAIVAGLGAGLDRSTFANFGEAREAAYEENIIPTQRAWAADIKVQLLNEFADILRYHVDFDLTNVRVLQSDQGSLWTRNLAALAGGGITRRTFKTNVGEIADETDDVYYRPIALEVVNAKEPPPALASATPVVAEKPPLPPLIPRSASNGNGASNGSGGAVSETVPVEVGTAG